MKKMMKKGGLALLMAGLVAVSLTSCLNGNDNQQQLTPAETLKAFNTVKGVRNGKLIYPARNPKVSTDITDTLDIAWDINTDSTLVIKEFPMKALAENVQNIELKQLLLTLPNQDLKCRIGFYSVMPAAFLINPIPLTYEVDKEGKKHKLQVVFYWNIRGSVGIFNPQKTTLGMQIAEAGIVVDSKLKEEFQRGVFMSMTEEKKK